MAMPWLLEQGDLNLNPGFPSYHPVYLCRYFNLFICPECRTTSTRLGGLARNTLTFATLHSTSVLLQMFIMCPSIIHVTQNQSHGSCKIQKLLYLLGK